MSKRELFAFIVEGTSEQVALENSLSDLLSPRNVRFMIFHGDITTKYGNTADTIISAVSSFISEKLKPYSLSISDLSQIIHLVDTDGAFIPDAQVLYNENAIKPFYDKERILTNDINKIVKRNIQKRSNLIRLSSRHSISGISYSVFYMSCNLDHVLFNKANSSEKEKQIYSERFARKYYGDLEGFISFFRTGPFSVKTDYKDSWKFIRNKTNSLHRYTNLTLLIEKYAQEKLRNSEYN